MAPSARRANHRFPAIFAPARRLPLPPDERARRGQGRSREARRRERPHDEEERGHEARLHVRGSPGGVGADQLAGGGPHRRRQAARLHAAVPARVAGSRGAADLPGGGGEAHPQPDPRARLPLHVRPGRGVHPALRARPHAVAPAGRRLPGARLPGVRRRGGQAHPPLQALPRGVRGRLRHAVRGDRAARGHRPGRARARAAGGGPHHPAHRVDDAAPLHRQRAGRPGARPAVQEPAEAPLDGGGPARQARHPHGRGAGRGAEPGGDRPRRGGLPLDRHDGGRGARAAGGVRRGQPGAGHGPRARPRITASRSSPSSAAGSGGRSSARA